MSESYRRRPVMAIPSGELSSAVAPRSMSVIELVKFSV
jgi:hypothetical protein